MGKVLAFPFFSGGRGDMTGLIDIGGPLPPDPFGCSRGGPLPRSAPLPERSPLPGGGPLPAGGPRPLPGIPRGGGRGGALLDNIILPVQRHCFTTAKSIITFYVFSP